MQRCPRCSAGNGPFGIGWSSLLPAITRRTGKGLPQYRNDEANPLLEQERPAPIDSWIASNDRRGKHRFFELVV